MTTTDIWLVDFACYDASCAPPPVGTGGSKPGPSRGHLSPKASERRNPPQSVVTSIYELRKHGLREAFDGEIKGGLSFSDETDVRWVSEDYGWHIEGGLVDKQGNTVAYFERAMRMDDKGKLYAHHETLRVYDDYQGKGIAQAFNNHLLDFYNRVGADRIELSTGHELGAYAWATQGYRIQGVEGGSNRYLWVDRRLNKMLELEQVKGDPDLRAEINALANANRRDEDIQPIHVASIGQNDPGAHWNDPDFGDMWPGKKVLVERDYQESRDFSRNWDGVYYLGS